MWILSLSAGAVAGGALACALAKYNLKALVIDSKERPWQYEPGRWPTAPNTRDIRRMGRA